ncbi:hypothetical protein E2P81_ATG11143 [Venturia nashicola]|nr:hypothetical protein E2P81_ATG11143 [Venturia nashicola]
MPKRNTNTTLTWNLPNQEHLLGVEKLFLIVGAIFLAVFTLFLTINVVVDEIRGFIRREVRSALKELRRRERRRNAEEQRKRRDIEIAPGDSASNGLRTPRNVKEEVVVVVVEEEVYWGSSQKNLAVNSKETEDEEWRRAGIEAGTCLLSEIVVEETTVTENDRGD